MLVSIVVTSVMERLKLFLMKHIKIGFLFASFVGGCRMKNFTDRELLILLNSVHERAMELLKLSSDMAKKGYRMPFYERSPTKEEIDQVDRGQREHFELVGKIRNVRKYRRIVDWMSVDENKTICVHFHDPRRGIECAGRNCPCDLYEGE